MTDYEKLTETFRQLGIHYIDERKLSYEGKIYHCVYPVSFLDCLYKSLEELKQSKYFFILRTYHFFEFDSEGLLASY